MGWLDPLRGQVVGVDTAPLIYYIERNPRYLSPVRPFFQALDHGAFSAVTSIVTLTEVLVHPFRSSNVRLAHRYRHILLRAPYVTTLAVSPTIAGEAAQLRASYNLRTPDALQLATARNAGASFYLTNDSKFSHIPGMVILDVETLLISGAQP